MRDSRVLRFILFVKNSELFKISIIKWNSTIREKKTLNYLKGHTLMKNNKLNFIHILHSVVQLQLLQYILLTRKRSFDAFFPGYPDNLRKTNEVVGNWNFLE